MPAIGSKIWMTLHTGVPTTSTTRIVAYGPISGVLPGETFAVINHGSGHRPDWWYEVEVDGQVIICHCGFAAPEDAQAHYAALERPLSPRLRQTNIRGMDEFTVDCIHPDFNVYIVNLKERGWGYQVRDDGRLVGQFVNGASPTPEDALYQCVDFIERHIKTNRS